MRPHNLRYRKVMGYPVDRTLSASSNGEYQGPGVAY